MATGGNLAELMKELKGMSGSEKLKKAAAAKLAYKQSMEAMRGGKALFDATILKPNRQYAGVKVHNPVSDGDVKRLVGDNYYRIDFTHEGKSYALYASNNSAKKNKLAKRLFERSMMGKVLIVGAHQNVVKKWTYVKLDAEANPSTLQSSVQEQSSVGSQVLGNTEVIGDTESSSSSSSSSSADPLAALWTKLSETQGSNLAQFLQSSSISEMEENTGVVEELVEGRKEESIPDLHVSHAPEYESDPESDIDDDLESAPAFESESKSEESCHHHCDGDTCSVPDFSLHGETDEDGEDLLLNADTSNILRDSA